MHCFLYLAHLRSEGVFCHESLFSHDFLVGSNEIYARAFDNPFDVHNNRWPVIIQTRGEFESNS